MTVALIPAAGKSQRMGRPKLSLPWGEGTVLEHLVRAFRDSGVDRVVTVIGPHVTELVPLAERAGAEVCLLPHETPDMRATVEAGLAWIESRHPIRDDDCWFLSPGDHPFVDAAVVAQLLGERTQHPEASIFIPTHAGKRGHPALIGWGHVAGIRQLPDGVGLNVYLRGQAAVTREVPVNSPGILVDLDTPEDYERARR
jgi:molybdenum cofactor cytidylyltransferase